MVSAAPKMMPPRARQEPSASVDMPVMPCPMLHPIASTPPTPMSTPPTICLTKSLSVVNQVRLKRPLSNADSAAPRTMPASAITPKVMRLASRGVDR